MWKKVCLLLLAGILILIVLPTAVVLFKLWIEPKPVEISESDFIKLLESHQNFERIWVSEETGGGATSHSVGGLYKTPSGKEVRFQTTDTDGPAANVEALMHKYDGEGPHSLSQLPLAKQLIRLRPIALPFALFLLVAWYLFRREVALIFRPKS